MTSNSSSSNNLVRLSKRMSELGLASRREADQMIEAGLVFVNGQKVTQLGSKVLPTDKIELAPQAKKQQAQLVTILLNKPIGYVSGQPEKGYEPAIRIITEDSFAGPGAAPFDPQELAGLAVAGRLDIDSQGLLVFTQDGRIAKHLIGENSDVEKEYLVRVEGNLPAEKLKTLQYGLMLDGKILKRAIVEWVNEDQLRFVLKEGRKRQVRRMCEAVGLKVTGLKRVRIGNIRLRDLPEGQWRLLRTDEFF
jgi:23S rRNA pseudouridine2604 synthase